MKHGIRGGAPQHVGDRVDVGAGQARVAGRVIEQGHSSPLHDAVLSQIYGLKRAYVQRDTSLRDALYPGPLALWAGTQGTVEEELRTSIPHQTVPMQFKTSCDVE
jgi:hypothetical protein